MKLQFTSTYTGQKAVIRLLLRHNRFRFADPPAASASQRDLSICPQPNCVRLAKHHGMVRGLPRGLSLRCSRYAPPKRLSAPTRITGGDVHRGAVDFEAARYGSLQIRPRFPVSHPPPGNSTSITGGNLTSQIATPIWLIPSRFFAEVTTCGVRRIRSSVAYTSKPGRLPASVLHSRTKGVIHLAISPRGIGICPDELHLGSRASQA